MTPQFYASMRTIILRDIADLRSGLLNYMFIGRPLPIKARQRDLVGLRAMRGAA